MSKKLINIEIEVSHELQGSASDIAEQIFDDYILPVFDAVSATSDAEAGKIIHLIASQIMILHAVNLQSDDFSELYQETLNTILSDIRENRGEVQL